MQRKRRLFQAVLPLIALIVTVGLLEVGMMQWKRWYELGIDRRTGRRAEPFPEAYNIGRYASYSINAPAWVMREHTSQFFTTSTNRFAVIQSSADWLYLLGAATMWYCIGAAVDRRRFRGETVVSPARYYWNIVRGTFLLLYSGLLLINGIERWGGLYAYWFAASLVLWGLALLTGALWILRCTLYPAQTPRLKRTTG